ncbi:MAG TPA: LysR substrate-binding domain-containing protein [Sphingobium sp.]|uniref:LysR family transcriptional regulator n=1 Tax=Sphingobium sp. TaxID=1912891 RepID=UPI002ED13CB0
MDTRHLRSFLKIVETGSISRAAESLGIAQPSLSQQLLRLEDEVGQTLFRRTARGVALTEAGRIFQEHARLILRASQQALEDVRDLNMEVSGEVVLAVPYSISKLAGFALVDAFRRHAPLVSFRLVEAMTGQIRGWLDAGKVDLGILYDMGPLRHLSARRLAREELYLIGPPGRFGTLDDLPEVAPVALAELPMILPGPQHGLRQFIDQELGKQGVRIDVIQDLDAMAHIPPLVAKDYGFSILPLPAVQDDLDAGRISIARIGDGAIRRTLCLVRNAGTVVTHASVRCEDLTVKVLTGLIDKQLWMAEPLTGHAPE